MSALPLSVLQDGVSAAVDVSVTVPLVLGTSCD